MLAHCKGVYERYAIFVFFQAFAYLLGVAAAPLVAARTPAALRLVAAAQELFEERGFHATTTRDIAERAGMSPAAVYVHYPSKLALLEEISRAGHEAAARCLHDALELGETSRERIWNATSAFARWHAEHKTVARIVRYENRALSGEVREEIRTLRRRMQYAVEAEIQRGVREGIFAVDDVPIAALTVISLCVDVARWHGPEDGRTPAEVGEALARLAVAMLGSCR